MTADNNDNDEPSSKRLRQDGDINGGEISLYVPPPELQDDGINNGTNSNDIRTSSLASATMKLSGHKGSVYCLAYDPQGEVMCSGSFDSTCLIWNGELVDGSLNYFVFQAGCILLCDFNCCARDGIYLLSRSTGI